MILGAPNGDHITINITLNTTHPIPVADRKAIQEAILTTGKELPNYSFLFYLLSYFFADIAVLKRTATTAAEVLKTMDIRRAYVRSIQEEDPTSTVTFEQS